MSEEKRTNLMKYGIAAGVVVLIAIVHICLNKDFGTMELYNKFRVLTDAFTIPGIILIMVGLLFWVSNQGTLDGLGYITSHGFKALFPGGRTGEKHEKYLDYVERKREKRVKGYSFLFIVGGVSIAIAMIFMALFYIFR